MGNWSDVLCVLCTGITEVGANAREINMFRGAVAYGGGNAFTQIGAAKKAGKGPLDEILTIQSSESESESDDDEAKKRRRYVYFNSRTGNWYDDVFLSTGGSNSTRASTGRPFRARLRSPGWTTSWTPRMTSRWARGRTWARLSEPRSSRQTYTQSLRVKSRPRR